MVAISFGGINNFEVVLIFKRKMKHHFKDCLSKEGFFPLQNLRGTAQQKSTQRQDRLLFSEKGRPDVRQGLEVVGSELRTVSAQKK